MSERVSRKIRNRKRIILKKIKVIIAKVVLVAIILLVLLSLGVRLYEASTEIRITIGIVLVLPCVVLWCIKTIFD